MDKIGYKPISREKEDLNILIQNYLDSSKGLNSLISGQSNIKLLMENIISKSIILPLNLAHVEKLQIYYSRKTKLLYSGNTSQEEAVEYQMTIYNLNYTSTEKQFYSQLTQEEKREWDTLPQDTKQFVLEAMTPEGQRLIEKLNHKLDSCIEKVEKLTFFGI